jgi:hypothetical protein
MASAALLAICVSVFLIWAPRSLHIKNFKN